ncbi:hypothetical protein Hanom_Chr04g00319171 [Helianthus anomalus]
MKGTRSYRKLSPDCRRPSCLLSVLHCSLSLSHLEQKSPPPITATPPSENPPVNRTDRRSEPPTAGFFLSLLASLFRFRLQPSLSTTGRGSGPFLFPMQGGVSLNKTTTATAGRGGGSLPSLEIIGEGEGLVVRVVCRRNEKAGGRPELRSPVIGV